MQSCVRLELGTWCQLRLRRGHEYYETNTTLFPTNRTNFRYEFYIISMEKNKNKYCHRLIFSPKNKNKINFETFITNCFAKNCSLCAVWKLIQRLTAEYESLQTVKHEQEVIIAQLTHSSLPVWKPKFNAQQNAIFEGTKCIFECTFFCFNIAWNEY